MKIKDIVRILSAVDWGNELYLEEGENNAERAALGLLEYEKGECLNYLFVNEITISECPDCEEMLVTAKLRHDNWNSQVLAEYMEKGRKKVEDED